MNAWLLTALVIAYFVGGYLYAHRLRAYKFHVREDLAFEEIYKASFRDIGVCEDAAHALWQEAAKSLRIPAVKLRPSDRFDKELSYCLRWFPFIDLNDEFYVLLVKRTNEKNIPVDEANQWANLADYIIGLTAIRN